MTKNPDLYDIHDVCQYFNLSESTIRRHLKNSRDGVGAFPLPLFKSGCKVLWRKEDIETWTGEDTESVTFAHSALTHQSPATRAMETAQILKGLGDRHNIEASRPSIRKTNGK